MWESRTIQIEVQLPHDIADQAEEVQKSDPEFLSRVVLYGLTRRSIYRQLRDRNRDMTSEMEAHVFTPEEQGYLAVLRGGGVEGFTPEERAKFDAAGEDLLGRVVPIEESEGRRILEENRRHDGGAWADKEGGR